MNELEVRITAIEEDVEKKMKIVKQVVETTEAVWNRVTLVESTYEDTLVKLNELNKIYKLGLKEIFDFMHVLDSKSDELERKCNLMAESSKVNTGNVQPNDSVIHRHNLLDPQLQPDQELGSNDVHLTKDARSGNTEAGTNKARTDDLYCNVIDDRTALQQSRRSHIILYNLPETDELDKEQRDLNRVERFINESLQLERRISLSPNQLMRLGPKTNASEIRPIRIMFTSELDKIMVVEK